MPLNLYFPNQELRTCQKVKNVTAQPIAFDVTRQSPVFRNEFDHEVKLLVKKTAENVPNGSVTLPGTAIKFTSVTPKPLEGGIAFTSDAMMAELGGATLVPSDSVAGAALRQSAIKFTHWKVPVQATGGEPDFMLVSIDEYPDGYSNCPPSWWEDPNPTNA